MADKFATSASYTVSGATVVGGALSLSDIALVIGIIGTIATLVLTWYFKKRSDHREQIRHEIELKKLDAEIKRIAQEASK